MSKWNSPEWEALYSGEACPICRDGRPLGIVAAELTYLTSSPKSPMRGYCCPVLKRHAVELSDLSADEGAALNEGYTTGCQGAMDLVVQFDCTGNDLQQHDSSFAPAPVTALQRRSVRRGGRLIRDGFRNRLIRQESLRTSGIDYRRG